MKFALLNILLMFVVHNPINHAGDSSQTVPFKIREADRCKSDTVCCLQRIVQGPPHFYFKMHNPNNSTPTANNSTGKIGYTSPNEASTLDLAQLCEEITDVADGPLLDHQHCIDEMFEDSLDAKPHQVKRNFQTYKVVNRIFLATAQFKNTARQVWENVSKQHES